MTKRKTAVQEYFEEEIPQREWLNYAPFGVSVRRIDVMRSMEEDGHTQKEINDWMFFLDCRMERLKVKEVK